MTMLLECEAEKTTLVANLAVLARSKATANILPYRVLLKQFTREAEVLRASLDGDAVSTDATAVPATLIESVTIYPQGDSDADAEVVAKVGDLLT